MKQIDTPRASKLFQKLQWVIDPVRYMEETAQKYPEIFRAQIVGLGNNLIFVNHPEAIQSILTNDRKTFSAPGETNQILLPLVGESSILLLDGNRHKRQRQLLMPPFHGDRMRNYGQLIYDLTEQAMQQLQTDRPFTARSVTQSISLQVILKAVFGVQEGERYEKLRAIMSALGDRFSSPFSSALLFFPFLQQDWGALSPWGAFLHRRQQLDDLLYAEIRDRRTYPDPERTDILSLLMSATDEAGNPLTDEELRDELVTLMLAGHETTATALAWALYWIHHQPGVRDKLLQELDSLEDKITDPTSIARLPYLTAVCQETLRLYPVAMLTFPRVVQQPVELLGYALEPKAIVVGCIYLVHQREDIYPNPKQFKPERFLEGKIPNYAFIPFGGGARRCIGEALALYEMKVVLATILSRYDLALAESRPVLPQRRGVTLSPRGGVKMILKGQRRDRTQAHPPKPAMSSINHQ